MRTRYGLSPWIDLAPPSRTAAFERLLELLRPRAKRLTDFVEQAAPIVVDDVQYTPEAVEKHLGAAGLDKHLEALAAALTAIPQFDEASTEGALRGTATALGIKAGALIHATRVSVTGQGNSPGIFEVLELVGRERVIARLRARI